MQNSDNFEKKYSDYNEILTEAVRLVSMSDRGQNDYIASNFRLGRLVAFLQDSARYGDRAVLRLAEDLTKKKGYTVYPQRLWECARVWRAFDGDIQKVWALEKKMQIKVTWSFLVRNCTPAIPESTGELESQAFWDKKLSAWENTVEEISNVIANKDKVIEKMPPATREQFEGFCKKIENPKFASVPDNKLVSLFKRIDALLDECLSGRLTVDEDTRRYLESVQDKIQRILSQAVA